MDLQGFLVRRHFVVKEFAVLEEEHVLHHHIFGCLYPWTLLSKSERHQAMWLIENRHRMGGWNGSILHGRKFYYKGGGYNDD